MNVFVGSNVSDTIHGGSGRDFYRYFNTTDGDDVIFNFTSGSDVFLLTSSAFGVSSNDGFILDSQFTIGSAATTADHRLIYNNATGDLFWDADGTGAAAASAIAHFGDAFSPAPASLSRTDFQVL
jgi:Ca2+-binding RTX toxin-like protein